MNTPVPVRGLLPPEWRVQLPEFEGPLDLLLHLVKINQVEITDIPVATVCDQFHAYLALADELDLDLAAEYIYEAALLIHLKSRMLLPRPTRADGEPEEDPREELVHRLLEYRRLKEAAQSLAEIESLRRGIWRREVPTQDAAGGGEEEEVDFGDLSLFDLLASLRQVLTAYDKAHPPAYHLELESFSVRDQVRRLLAALDRGRPFDLLADLRARSCRAEVIAAFLAVLELARLSLVRLHQTDAGEVVLYRTVREAAAEELETVAG
jgi:segregation and condensation protein A